MLKEIKNNYYRTIASRWLAEFHVFLKYIESNFICVCVCVCVYT